MKQDQEKAIDAFHDMALVAYKVLKKRAEINEEFHKLSEANTPPEKMREIIVKMQLLDEIFALFDEKHSQA